MIRDVIDLLRANEYADGSEIIQFAKGKYKTPSGFNGWINYIKRRVYGRRD